MKKEYMKPAMQVVEIRQYQILCGSPGGYNSQSLQMRGGSPANQIDDEENVW